jgi:hypothetical protein
MPVTAVRSFPNRLMIASYTSRRRSDSTSRSISGNDVRRSLRKRSNKSRCSRGLAVATNSA